MAFTTSIHQLNTQKEPQTLVFQQVKAECRKMIEKLIDGILKALNTKG